MIGWLLLALAAPAPPGPPAVVTVATSRVDLATGERGEVAIVARIEEGFRIQANPASQPFLVAAQLELSGGDGIEVGPPAYPPGEPYRLHGTAEDLSVYEGEVVIRVPLHARPLPGGQARGESVLEGRLRYQACNERVCLRPSSAKVEVRVSRPRGGPSR